MSNNQTQGTVASQRQLAAETAETSPAHGRVLVVDDEAQIRDMLARVLRAAGHTVTVATDGDSALAVLKEQEQDVIVSDIVMPGMTGIELMRAVREVDLDTPIILLTGTPSLQTARDAVDLGGFRYLTKPVDRDELQATISRALAMGRMARLKRDALALAAGAEASAAGDIAGLQVSFNRALTNLWMAFQPIVQARDGSVFGCEALLRSEEPALPHPGAMLDAAERLDRVGYGSSRSTVPRWNHMTIRPAVDEARATPRYV